MSAAVWMAEARQSWRGLLRRPGYLLLAALTLALGVATSALVFALIDQALLQPLPFPQAERLATVGRVDGANRVAGSPGFYNRSKEMAGLESSGMAMRYTRNVNIASGDVAEVVPGLYADRGFLHTLGLAPALGRNFSADEDRPGGAQAAILGHDLWQRRFGGDQGVIGRTLQVEGKPVEIVGVLPRSFAWPDRFDLLLPLQPDPASSSASTNEYIVARLRPGVSLEAVSAEADSVLRQIFRDGASRERMQQQRIGALPLLDSVFANRSGKVLWMFMAAALCVLAIAAVNLANLMLLRAMARDHDVTVRAALGASARRLALPALAESALIGLAGAAAGLLLAWIGLRLLGNGVPAEWLRGQVPRLGGAGIAFGVLAGLGVAGLGAAIGLLRGRRRALTAVLSGGGRSGLTRGAGRLAKALIVVQVAVAVLLLTNAALFARSLQKLAEVPLGFEDRAVVTFTLSPVRTLAPDLAATMTQTRRLLDGFVLQPGVTRAGASTNLPTGSQFNLPVEFADGRTVAVEYRPVTADFLAAFGIPLLSGRALDARGDVAGSESVALVSETFARDHLDGQALGKVLRLPLGEGMAPTVRVVGVVGDVRQSGPTQPAEAALYVPLAQMTDPVWTLARDFMPLNYAVQLQPGMEAGFMRRLPELVRQAAPGQPIASVQTMQAVVAATTREQKLNLVLVGVFSALALLLAAVGLYAVMAVAVAARRHEFGVRAALGAPPARLLRQVLSEAGVQIGLGLVIGLGVAMALSRVLQRFLFGIGVADPPAIALVIAVLALAGLLASLLPALRAARVPPMQALRNE